MPVPKNQIRHKWVPKGRGKGGMFPNSTPYDSDADVLIDVQDAVIYGDAWVPRPAEILFYSDLNYTFPAYVTSMICANFYVSGTPVSKIVAANNGGLVMLQDQTVRFNIFSGTANNRFVFNHVKNRTYACNGKDSPFILSSPSPVVFPSSTCYKWGGIPQTGTLTYSLTVNTVAAGSLSTVTNGSTAIVGTGTSFTSATAGNPLFALGARYQIASITDNTHLTLTTPYLGTTGTVANGAWQINTGTMAWDPASQTPGLLQYAVSYFDPASGHTTNLSTPITISDGAPNSDGVASINITNIVMNQDARFTDILLWRTAHGGSTFFPRAIITNGAAGTTSFNDSDNVDSHLGVTTFMGTGGGASQSDNPGLIAGPQNTNFPPPADLNYAGYWDGRFWASSKSQPGLIFFSARNDFSVQEITMGVGEECWPSVNTLPVPDSDGSHTGTHVVGGAIFLTTEKGTYTVVGNSNNNYRLIRVTAKGNGGNHFAMATLPGEDTNSSDILVHVGNDRRIYYLYGPGGDVAYSYPIQPRLSPQSVNPPVLQNGAMGILHNTQGTYLLWSDGGLPQQGTSLFTWAFDVERQTWFEWSLGYNGNNSGVTAMCEGLFNGVNRFFISTTKGLFYLQEDPTASQITGALLISTQRFAPPSVPRAVDKILESFHIFDSLGGSGTLYNVSVDLDSTPILQMPPVNSSTSSPLAVLTEPSEIMFMGSYTGPSLLQSRTFQFIIVNGVVPFKIAQMEAVWSVTSTTGEEGIE